MMKSLIMMMVMAATITGWSQQTKADKMKIVYVGDPMCSWCYGISEELSQVTEHYRGKLDFQLVVGGLRPGGGDEWDAKFKDFLKHHWEDVSQKSGVPFSYELLNKADFLYDTEPSCRASVVVRDLANDKVMDFFKATQKGFYFENKDPKQASFYKGICESLDIDYNAFLVKFESEEYKNLTKMDFQYAGKIGVRSFPTILLEKDGQLYMVASGFADKKTMIERIDGLMK